MDTVVYAKTASGCRELRERALRLSGRLRCLLVMIDGHKSAGALVAALAPMGVTVESLQELERAGLICRVAVPQGSEAPAAPATESRSSPKASGTVSKFRSDSLGNMLVGGLIQLEDFQLPGSESAGAPRSDKS